MWHALKHSQRQSGVSRLATLFRGELMDSSTDFTLDQIEPLFALCRCGVLDMSQGEREVMWHRYHQLLQHGSPLEDTDEESDSYEPV